MNNKPLSIYRQKTLCACFAHELTATQTAGLLGINRNTVNRYYRLIREAIYYLQVVESVGRVRGALELDESYFGGVHKGNKGRSTKSKIPVFGILKRNGKVYTEIVPDVKAVTLRRIIKRHIRSGSTLYTDAFASYDGLVLDGYEHIRINHSVAMVTGRGNHINGIESFWSYAKNKLAKFYGIRAKDFPYYLKEMEFRFNRRGEQLEKSIYVALRAYRLSHSAHRNTTTSTTLNDPKC